MKSGSCIFCPTPKKYTAERKQWLIHLFKHREDIIKFIVDNYSSCVLCAYPKPFDSKSGAAGHLRWKHRRRSLVDWFFRNFIGRNH